MQEMTDIWYKVICNRKIWYTITNLQCGNFKERALCLRFGTIFYPSLLCREGLLHFY